jgi:hypothetical protein
MRYILKNAFVDAVSVLIMVAIGCFGIWLTALLFLPGLNLWQVLAQGQSAFIAGILFGGALRFTTSFVVNMMLSGRLADVARIEFIEAAKLICNFRYFGKLSEIDSLDQASFHRDYLEYKRRELL